MQSVGLSMALGAFLTGVLLAESEYRRELETDIEPFKGLLLGLFFIAVGMSIDFAWCWRNRCLVARVVAGFLASRPRCCQGHGRAMPIPSARATPVFPDPAAGARRRVPVRGVPETPLGQRDRRAQLPRCWWRRWR